MFDRDTSPPLRERWVAGLERTKRWSLVLALFAVFGLVFLPTTKELIDAWFHELGYSHGLLVLLVSVYLIGREVRRDLPLFPPPPLWLVLLALMLSGLWILAYTSATQAVQMIALVGLLFCACSAFFGAKPMTRFAVPAGIMIFAVPIWGVISPLLQSITISVNSFILTKMGWNAFIDGDLVHVQAGSFEIAEGCSGIHFFVVALTLSVLYAHLNLRRRAAQIAIVVCAAAVAMITNWLRVLTLIIVGDLTDMQHFLIAVDHYYFGWAVFFLALIPLFFLGARPSSLGGQLSSRRSPWQQFGRELPATRKGVCAVETCACHHLLRISSVGRCCLIQ